MNRDPNGPPNQRGEYPKIPAREGLEGVPEESEPAQIKIRIADAFLVLAAAAASISLLLFLVWWSSSGR